MAARGWYVQPQMSYAGTAADHPPLGERRDRRPRRRAPRRAPRVGRRGPDAGPVAVDPGVVGVHRGARPGHAHRRRLRRPAGRLGPGRRGRRRRGLALPERMAEVNALLDLAAPAMREALLVAFLDRLSRPNRRDGAAAASRWSRSLHRRGLERLPASSRRSHRAGSTGGCPCTPRAATTSTAGPRATPTTGSTASSWPTGSSPSIPALAEAGRGQRPGVRRLGQPCGRAGPAGLAAVLLRRLGDRRHRRVPLTGPEDGRPTLEEPPGGR